LPQNWFVHVGTDRSRSPGPIRVTVLPGLFDIGGAAFAMVHGNGLGGLPVPTAPSGLVAAAGFEFSTKYGAPPIWADLHASAMVAVSTTPVFLAGRVEVGGGLHLGPFSLGVDATLDLQVGPGATFAASLEVCGSIDLWFTEISGCVHLSFGETQRPALDPPPSPVAGFAVGDPWGRREPGVTTCWPDGVVLVDFTPGPGREPSGVPQGSFDLASTPATPGGGRVGDPAGYHVDYTVAAVRLRRGSGAELGPNLPATWQQPAGQVHPAMPGGRVLALLSTNPALWAEHVIERDPDNPTDPLFTQIRGCREGWRATPGWALGGLATPRAGGSWRVPNRAGASDATMSLVNGSVTTRLDSSPVTWNLTPYLPLGSEVMLAGVVTEQVPTIVTDDAPGWLTLADVRRPGRMEDREVVGVQTQIVLDDPLVADASLVLLTRDTFDWFDGLTAWARKPDGSSYPISWSIADQQSTAQGEVSLWRANEAGPIWRIDIDHPIPRGDADVNAIGLVAVGGITATAQAAADDANAAAQAAHADPADDQPVVPAVLEPGKKYTVEVDWKGEAQKPDASPASRSGTATFEFEVAPEGDAPPPDRLHLATDVFHPSMLVRYLRSYRPNPDVAWFTADRLGAVMDPHLVTVASAYKYATSLGLARTDPLPGSAPSPRKWWQRFALAKETPRRVLDPWLLRDNEAIVATAIADAGCVWTHGPVEFLVDAKLEPAATYELGVQLTKNKQATRLPPVVFRTSRWPDPAAMFRALGFDDTGNVIGLLVAAAPVAVAPSTPASDVDLLRALSGLDVPAFAGDARTSVLWIDDNGTPAISGVLVECVEPLVRAHRVDDVSLADSAGATWTTIADRSACTMLFVAPTAVASGTTLTLHWTDTPPGASPAAMSAQLNVVAPRAELLALRGAS
jgi:hypothetical protein